MSPRRHTPWARGALAAVVLTVVRTVTLTFTPACGGPEPGEAGGECKDTGCRLTCNEGLHCDTVRNRCGGFPSPPPPPPAAAPNSDAQTTRDAQTDSADADGRDATVDSADADSRDE